MNERRLTGLRREGDHRAKCCTWNAGSWKPCLHCVSLGLTAPGAAQTLPCSSFRVGLFCSALWLRGWSTLWQASECPSFLELKDVWRGCVLLTRASIRVLFPALAAVSVAGTRFRLSPCDLVPLRECPAPRGGRG